MAKGPTTVFTWQLLLPVIQSKITFLVYNNKLKEPVSAVILTVYSSSRKT